MRVGVADVEGSSRKAESGLETIDWGLTTAKGKAEVRDQRSEVRGAKLKFESGKVKF